MLHLADVHPVLPVVCHVIATEGEHCHGIAAKFSNRTSGRGCLFGSNNRSKKMSPESSSQLR